MTCRLDRLCHPTFLESRAWRARFHNTFLTQIFGPPKIGPDGYPGRHMARPSAILQRFWLQNNLQNGTNKLYNSDFGEIVILLPLPCEINVFTVQDPSKNNTKSLQKKSLQPDPPKILNFQPQGASGWQHEPKRLPKGFLLGRGAGNAPKTSFLLSEAVLGPGWPLRARKPRCWKLF